jgi:hypothetical protein
MSIEWLILLGVSVLLFGGMVGCYELGFRLGRVSRTQDQEAFSETSVIDAGVFALLGLLLAFQFSAAASRLDVRRQVSVQEVITIRTAYEQLDMLADEDQPALRKLFRQFLDARIRGRQLMPDLKAAEVEYLKAQALHTQIWARAIAGCKNPNALPGAEEVLLPSINEMGELQKVGAAAAVTHSPPFINVFTFIVALIASMLAGAPASSTSKRPWLHVFLFAAAISITYFVILDLEYPRIGFIRIGMPDQLMQEVRQLMD